MSEQNPFYAVRQIVSGFILPRCLHVAAELGVADALDDSPRTAAELAASVGAHPDALRRVLTLLSAHGVFEAHGDQFVHTPASRLLRSDHPQSMRAYARMYANQINWTSYGMLEHSVRTGLPARDQVIPEGIWAYYTEHPDQGQIFNEAMAGRGQAAVAGVVGAYDFSGFDVIGDIGGGIGHLLRAVLAATPNAKGVLFDLPYSVEKVKDLASERLMLRGGDFFNDPLPVCDAYMVMDVIHDWTDEKSVEILKAIRRAAPARAKLLVIETIIPDDPGPHWAKMVDIHMMTLTGGRQRTRREHEILFEKAGFKLVREINTPSSSSILEALPV